MFRKCFPLHIFILIVAGIITTTYSYSFINYSNYYEEKIVLHSLSTHYFFFQNKLAPLSIFLYNVSGFNRSETKFEAKWPMERQKMHTEIFEPLFYHQMQEYCYKTNDPLKADVFGTPIIISYQPYIKLTQSVIPFINKTGPYLMRYGGVDHFFIHVVFCSSFFSIGYQEQKFLPYSLSLPDFHWSWSINNVRQSWRTTIIPYTSNQETSPLNKSISIFFIGTMSPSFLGGTGKKVRRAMADVLENISGSVVIKTLRHSKKNHATKYNISKMIRESLFCAVPFGDSPSSKRMFDSFRGRCIPIVLSDDIRFPFEESMINYQFFVTQINMSHPERIQEAMMVLNDRKIEQIRHEMEQIDEILDVATDKQFTIGDQTWAWLWHEYIKACIVSSVKRRDLKQNLLY
ncbi:Exostosin family protein [Tritrichomonas foetus]|uniref:Exostosin family protein n=1 Tax=Tritrichomonas foetus TaxID=1144522 RepID=A0A1J4JLM0_9EUKA|nr:Exostosin family protein [Tritrichomonas foetus]|eukprot:OHT00009.1 Exostosin family protein [Tritrichomonas foetus]